MQHLPSEVKTVLVCGSLWIHTVPKVASWSTRESAKAVRVHPTDKSEKDDYHWMCIRHPLDRLVSCWAYFCHSAISGDRFFRACEGYRRGMPFSEFLAVCRQNYFRDKHTMPQVWFTGGHVIDEMVRMEHLDAAWERLRSRYPKRLRPLKHGNTTSHDDWRNYYTRETASQAELTYAEDMEAYDSLS